MAVDLETLRRCIGRRDARTETIVPEPAARLAAMLDRDPDAMRPGTPLPPLYHWVYFVSAVPQSGLGADGHPSHGDFLPPSPLPRRMWASSALDFLAPLCIGDSATRTSEILDVTVKEGRSGSLVFFSLRHGITGSDGRLAIDERQQIVFRDLPAPAATSAAGAAAPDDAAWTLEVRPETTLLFRYSAITFNSHRIHYDRPYATGVEGYPGLVVQGPLVATMLADALVLRHPGQALRRFGFRAVKPLFDDRPFLLCGAPAAEPDGMRLWSRDADGAICTDARAAFR